MNGIHDIGGMHGLGPINVPEQEPVFYADWERQVFGTIALMFAGAACPPDVFRHSIERMDPAEYLATPYYVHWLHAAETLGVEQGLFTRQELDTRCAELAATNEPMHKIAKDDIWDSVHAVTDFRAEGSETPRFQAGDAVVIRNINPTGHTRLPRFVRGRTGTVQQRRGSFVFPDSMAHGLGAKPQHLYSVRFAARDLWGSTAAENDYVYLDLWDDYIGGAVETTFND